MKIWFSLLAVLIIVFVSWIGVGVFQLTTLFGIIVPYLAFVIFLTGVIYRVVKWGKSPVPFSIPTTCGQQESLPWIKKAPLENPSTIWGVVGRMALEIFLFRSLFRNLTTEKNGDKLAFGSAKWLWLFGLMFHWSMLIVIVRHLRLFLDPVPAFLQGLQAIDSMLQIGVPALYITNILLLAGLTYLFLRRVVVSRVRYISLAADYFPLFLLLGIATTGVLMRYFIRVDIPVVKQLAMSLVSLKPIATTEIGTIFYIHLFLISSLFAYFPWSKLMHAGGVFLSPTRNLPNNSRMVRYENPWNYDVKVHNYAEYEDQYRDKMRKAGIPLERE